jgi:hypothetical protein
VLDCGEIYHLLALSDDHVGVVCMGKRFTSRPVVGYNQQYEPSWHTLELIIYHTHTCKKVLSYSLMDSFTGIIADVPKIAYADGTVGVATRRTGIAISSHISCSS